MSDHEEIRNLIARYAHHADDWEFEKQAALFAPDGVLVEGGREIPMHTTNIELARNYVAALAAKPQPAGFKHIQANTAIEVDGDRATATSDLVSLRLSPDKGWSIGSGRYDDMFVRIGGKWLFERRAVTFYRNLGLDPNDASRDADLDRLIDAAKAATADVGSVS